MSGRSPVFSVVVPVYNGGNVLEQCLKALAQSDVPRASWELIVVDDGSSDDTAALAARFADVVLRLAGPPRGPAYARNRGVEVSRGEFIVFLDADIKAKPDTLSRFQRAFSSRVGRAAVCGSYDTVPSDLGVISQYRNLLRHHQQQSSRGASAAFWAGCGAARREAFIAAGMYDEWRYPRPQIEDIELGQRLRACGTTVELDGDIQVTHLKRWTLGTMLRTDLRDRGLPWMRLGGTMQTHIRSGNTPWNRRDLVGIIAGLVTGFCACVALALGSRSWATAAACAVAIALGVRFSLYRFFVRERGVAFATLSVPLTIVSDAVTGMALLIGWATYEVLGEPRPDPLTEAFSEVGVQTWPPVPTRAPPATAPAVSPR